MQILMQKERRLTRKKVAVSDKSRYLTTLDHLKAEDMPHECLVGLVQKLEASRLSSLISSCGPRYLPAGRHSQLKSTFLIVTVPGRRLSRSSFSCALITLIRIYLRCS